MRKLVLAVVLVVMALIGQHYLLSVSAQSFGVSGIGPIAPTVAQCPVGIASFAFICPVGSGTSFQIYVSYNGGAYIPLATQGQQGIPGATGAQGPPGPVLTSCPNASLGALTGLIFGSGCK